VSDQSLVPWFFALWALGAVHTAAMVRTMVKSRGDEPDADIVLAHGLAWPIVAAAMFVVHVFGIAVALAWGGDDEDDDGSPGSDDGDP
jgi:hypothetical protein